MPRHKVHDYSPGRIKQLQGISLKSHSFSVDIHPLLCEIPDDAVQGSSALPPAGPDGVARLGQPDLRQSAVVPVPHKAGPATECHLEHLPQEQLRAAASRLAQARHGLRPRRAQPLPGGVRQQDKARGRATTQWLRGPQASPGHREHQRRG